MVEVKRTLQELLCEVQLLPKGSSRGALPSSGKVKDEASGTERFWQKNKSKVALSQSTFLKSFTLDFIWFSLKCLISNSISYSFYLENTQY